MQRLLIVSGLESIDGQKDGVCAEGTANDPSSCDVILSGNDHDL